MKIRRKLDNLKNEMYKLNLYVVVISFTEEEGDFWSNTTEL